MNTTRTAETAEDVLVRQHATIAAAIDLLQRTLEEMPAPGYGPILWGDVAEFAHVAEAAKVLMDYVGHDDNGPQGDELR